jgi:hypothetical protein
VPFYRAKEKIISYNQKNFKANDRYFNTIFNKFCTNPLYPEMFSELVQFLLMKLDLTYPPEVTSNDICYLGDCLYAFTSYIITGSKLIKSKKRMSDISTDINKGVLGKG